MSDNTFNIEGMSTFVALPVDTTSENSFIQLSDHLQIVKNVILKTLSDGTICLLNTNDVNLNQEPQQILDGTMFLNTVNAIQEKLEPETPKIEIQTPLNQSPQKAEKPITTYKCPKCKEVFTKIALFRKHMSWHRNMKKFKCDQCSASYNVESNLKIHMAMHAEGKPKCPICALSFQRTASLKSHLLLHQVEELYNCEECSAEFEKEEELNRHLQSHLNQAQDNDNLICSYCKVKFEDPKTYKEHISHHVKMKKMVLSGKKSRKTHGCREYSYICGVCQKSFSKSSLLERHLRVHSGERPFVCHLCEKGFNQKGTLQIHLDKHKDMKPFHCTLCSAKFNQKGNLRVHVEKTHTAPQPGVKTYKCAHCNCIFKKVASLNVHVTKTHATDDANVDNVLCNLKDLETAEKEKQQTVDKDKENIGENVKNAKEEGTSFVKLAESFSDGSVRRYLVKQRKVNDVRYYICTYCNKEFKKPSDLIRHTRVHTREKPFTCKQCGTSFSLKSTLLCHIKTHIPSNIHTCAFCKKKFSSAKTLNLHLKRHNDRPLYKCTVCNKLLTSQQKANLHQQTHLNQSGKDLNHISLIKQPLIELAQFQQTDETRIFQCQHCNLKFTKSQTFNRHLLSHETEKKYKCDFCPKSYFSAHSLKEHSLIHNGVKNFICKLCGKRFMTSSRLKKHTLSHSVQCQDCNEVFSNVQMLKKHMSVHKEITNDVNNVTTSVNQSDPTLNMNLPPSDPIIEPQINSNPVQIVLNHNKDGAAEDLREVRTVFITCDDLQLVENNLYSQLKLQNSDFLNPLTDLQDANVFSIDGLNSDLDVQNSEIYNTNQIFNVINNEQAEPPSIAELASRILKTDPPVAKKVENSGGDIVLANNGSYYSNSDINLFLNLDSDFVSNETLSLTDINLGEGPALNVQESVENQAKSKSEEKPVEKFDCSKCKKSFSTQSSFSKHMNTHNTVNKVIVLHNCDFCGKEFKKQSDLIRHVRTHTGEKPFSCDKCDRKFSLKSTLQSHQRTHNPVSPKTYNCVVCNSFFTSKSSLKVHMHLHTGAKPHQCNFCEMKFRTAAHRKAHEASYHATSLNKKPKNKASNVLESVAMEVLNDQNQTLATNDSGNQLLENILVVQEPLQIPGDQLNILSETNQNSLADSMILQQLQPSSFLFQDQLIPSLIQLDNGTLLNIKAISSDELKQSQAPEEQLIFQNIALEKPPEPLQSTPAIEKPRNLECDVCHKRYASKDVFRKHKRTHGVYRKFPCSKCDKGFDTEEDLDRHEKIHAGLRPYSCMFCSNSFTKKHGLTTHLKRIHKKSIGVPINDNFFLM